jgi:hypothetical protein
MGAARVVKNLSEISDKIPLRESHTEPLRNLNQDEQIKAWNEAVATAPDGNITARHIQQVVNEITKPHVSNNSGNNEWYTPPEYIEAARLAMGDIDLDPASSEFANTIVHASKYYDVNSNGLLYHWVGRVWMNPPYSGDLIGKFTEKLCEHFENGDIEQACILVNNATETGWYQRMFTSCSEVCFLKGRIRYLNSSGIPEHTPLQGQTILYFGNRRFEFINQFKQLGKILHND